MNRWICLAICMGWLSAQVLPQEPTPALLFLNQRSVGSYNLVGMPVYALPEGDVYKPLGVGVRIGMPLLTKAEHMRLTGELIPQGEVVFYGSEVHYEYGINAQLHFNFILSRIEILSISIGSGPHFFSTPTARQAKGFLFSDTFSLHYKRLGVWREKGMAWGLFAGFRHNSNASLAMPNDGIDNFIFGFVTHFRLPGMQLN